MLKSDLNIIYSINCLLLLWDTKPHHVPAVTSTDESRPTHRSSLLKHQYSNYICSHTHTHTLTKAHNNYTYPTLSHSHTPAERRCCHGSRSIHLRWDSITEEKSYIIITLLYPPWPQSEKRGPGGVRFVVCVLNFIHTQCVSPKHGCRSSNLVLSLLYFWTICLFETV